MCRPRLRPRQQTPFCRTVQLSLTLPYSNAAGIVMVSGLSFALTANHPAIKTFQQVPAPSRGNSYHPRQQQCNAHNTAHTKLLTTMQHSSYAEGSGHLTAGLLGAAQGQGCAVRTTLMHQRKPDAQIRTVTYQGQQTCLYSLCNSNR